MASEFSPETIIARRRQVDGKRQQDVNDPAFVLREGLYAKSRAVDDAAKGDIRPRLPSFGRSVLNKLSEI